MLKCSFVKASNLDRQEKRISQEIAALEKDTGYKLRLLAQNYPDTPGMAADAPSPS